MVKTIIRSLCLLLFISLSISAYDRSTDSLALIALYDSTNGDSWTNTVAGNSSWKSGSIDTWYGVTVENNRVTMIKLQSNNVDGSLPSEIGDLTELTNLWFQINSLSGSIPSEIGNLTKLQYFYLNYNQLTGSIPSTIGNLSSLVFLYIYRNSLSGSIPTGIGNISSLKRLYLYENSLTGNIPTTLGNLSNLEELRLSDNSFSGSIPTSLGNLSKLKQLWLHRTGISGQIPSELGNATNLEHLYLYSNSLGGTIPTSFGNLTKMVYLYIHDSELTGVIPKEMGGWTSIKRIYIDNNLLEDIEDSVTNITTLEILKLDNNKLCCLSSSVRKWADDNDANWELSQDCGTLPDDCGLIGHWEFYSDCNDCYNTAKDTAYDLTGNGFHLAQDLVGTSLITDSGFTNYFTLNPYTRYYQVWTLGSHVPEFAEYTYDYSYYIKFYNDSLKNSAYDNVPLIWRDNARGLSISYHTMTSDNGRLMFSDTAHWSSERLLSDDPLSEGWHSVAAVRENDTLKLYLDGILDSIKYVGTPSNHEDSEYFTIGGRAAGNALFMGTISETRYYQRAISASEVSSLHAASFPSGRSYTPVNSKLSEAAIATKQILPKEFKVTQNTPNPFKNSTSINFALPVSNSEEVKGYKTSIKIFDIRGRLVNTLINSELKSGVHSVVWNGMDSKNRGAKSGTYICKIEAGNYVKSIKMSLGK